MNINQSSKEETLKTPKTPPKEQIDESIPLSFASQLARFSYNSRHDNVASSSPCPAPVHTLPQRTPTHSLKAQERLETTNLVRSTPAPLKRARGTSTSRGAPGDVTKKRVKKEVIARIEDPDHCDNIGGMRLLLYSNPSDLEDDVLPKVPMKPTRQGSRRARGKVKKAEKSGDKPISGRSQDEDEPKKNKIKKAKRGFASPEKYAHLKALPDCIKEELDVLFCGINPGQTSAKIGHHFGGPTNHFWPCLYESGLTPFRMIPQQDGMLPKFNIGLTNLISRPTTEQDELAKSEFPTAVLPFLAKVVQYRPRIVAFVGVKIANAVRSQVIPKQKRVPRHTSGRTKSAPATPQGGGLKTEPDLANSEKKPEEQDPVTVKAEGLDLIPIANIGLQPYKLVYDTIARVNPEQEAEGTKESVLETLFYTLPSTSGRVVQYQRTDKIKLFRQLKETIESLKTKSIDTSRFHIIRSSSLSLSSFPKVGVEESKSFPEDVSLETRTRSG